MFRDNYFLLHTFANGFLPDQDPQCGLSEDYALNRELNTLIKQLPALLKAKMLRQTIFALEQKYENKLLIKINKLKPMEINAAWVILTMLMQAFIWEKSDQPARIIPAILSANIIALRAICQRIPVLTYADYTLHNWRRLNASDGITLHNIEPLFTFTGSKDEAGYIKTHVVVEAAFSKAIRAALKISSLADAPAQNKHLKVYLGKLFKKIALSIDEAIATLECMYRECAPSFFFTILRPYLEGVEKIEGIQFSLAGQIKEVHAYAGPSGAHSSTLPVFDALLNVEHSKNGTATLLKSFFIYMPNMHQEMIQRFDSKKIKALLDSAGGNIPEYKQAMGSLWQFRTKHLEIRNAYIIKPAKEANLPANRVASIVNAKTSIFLKKCTNETLEAIIKQSSSLQAKL